MLPLTHPDMLPLTHRPLPYPKGYAVGGRGPYNEETMPEPKLFKAIEQFNRREFWESHESLEDLWRADKGQLNQFYQGIIHVAAGFVHVQRSNFPGAVQRLQSGIEKLAPYEPMTQGVEVAKLNRETHKALLEVRELGSLRLGDFNEKFFPRIIYNQLA